jgi:hypothetical protein
MRFGTFLGFSASSAKQLCSDEFLLLLLLLLLLGLFDVVPLPLLVWLPGLIKIKPGLDFAKTGQPPSVTISLWRRILS